MRTDDIEGYVEHFRKRVLQDALNEATESYWLRRATTFSGVGTPACDEIARACRNRATLALIHDGTCTSPCVLCEADAAEVDQALHEAS